MAGIGILFDHPKPQKQKHIAGQTEEQILKLSDNPL
jgi:hypothetical protein